MLDRFNLCESWIYSSGISNYVKPSTFTIKLDGCFCYVQYYAICNEKYFLNKGFDSVPQCQGLKTAILKTRPRPKLWKENEVRWLWYEKWPKSTHNTRFVFNMFYVILASLLQLGTKRGTLPMRYPSCLGHFASWQTGQIVIPLR